MPLVSHFRQSDFRDRLQKCASLASMISRKLQHSYNDDPPPNDGGDETVGIEARRERRALFKLGFV